MAAGVHLRDRLLQRAVRRLCGNDAGVFFLLFFLKHLCSFQALIQRPPPLFQVTIFSYDIFLRSGIPSDKIRYVTLGQGLCDIFTSVFCVSGNLRPC